MDAIASGRRQLADWLDALPVNYFEANPLLRSLVERASSPAVFASIDAHLAQYGADIAGAADLVHKCSTPPNLPTLERWDAIGRRQERVRFDASYHQLGEIIYGSGVMGMTGDPAHAVLQAALVFLTAHHGEAGHTCPLACTAGLIQALQKVGHPRLQEGLLPGLLDPAYATRLHGSQFLTEVQGGCDVGANASRAVLETPETADSPAMWRIYGEKWFCSVADSPLYLVTARPEGAAGGTKGLGLFLVPHDLPDGAKAGPLAHALSHRALPQAPNPLNHFTIRRLKDKLGTRAMATGEIDCDGALAWQVGTLQNGFQTVIEVVLGTSRLYNALACAGSMQRAFYEARAFAATRTAFGRKIGQFPLVREAVAQLYTEACAALASTLDLVQLGAQGGESDAVRLGVNLNKYWTSVRNTQMQRLGIEVLGGNGTIEDFSPLPRLYRDAMVTESWEGTHNVLVAQTWRDMQRYALHRPFLALLQRRAEALGDAQNAQEVRERLIVLAGEAERLAAARDENETLALRSWMDNAMVAYQALCLGELDQWRQQRGEAAEAGMVAHLLALHPMRTAVAVRGQYPQ